MRLSFASVAFVIAFLPAVVRAQTTVAAPQQRTAVGEIGQRQTRDLDQRVNPVGRVASRIDNRVASRLATRLDRNYQVQAGAAASIERATRQVGEAPRRKR